MISLRGQYPSFIFTSLSRSYIVPNREIIRKINEIIVNICRNGWTRHSTIIYFKKKIFWKMRLGVMAVSLSLPPLGWGHTPAITG